MHKFGCRNEKKYTIVTDYVFKTNSSDNLTICLYNTRLVSDRKSQSISPHPCECDTEMFD